MNNEDVISPNAPSSERKSPPFPSTLSLERSGTDDSNPREPASEVRRETIFSAAAVLPGGLNCRVKARSLIFAIIFIIVGGAVILLAIWLSRRGA